MFTALEVSVCHGRDGVEEQFVALWTGNAEEK